MQKVFPNNTFVFTKRTKIKILTIALLGLLLIAFGVYSLISEASTDAHSNWLNRVYANLWINNTFFVGIIIVGVFFLALQYSSFAGWSAYIKRIPEAFGNLIPIFGILTVVIFGITNFTSHFHIFHWLDSSLYDVNSPNYDPIIAGKKGYLNLTFFLARMAIYFLLWHLMFHLIKKNSKKEDLNGGNSYFKKMRIYSTIFIIIFAVTSSTAAWDWVMSIDTHWFSTIFGWYSFSSWFVSAMAIIILVVIYLKSRGYLPLLSKEHLHDLGKFLFAFSIFWAYLWFSQFMLIYYANIPEESIYFYERISSPIYGPLFIANIIINFLFPFLVLMTRDAKRKQNMLVFVSSVILLGHWLDFYLMITPGTLSEQGNIGFIEVGTFLIFVSLFAFLLLKSLTKAPLVAKNHPLLGESLHYHS